MNKYTVYLKDLVNWVTVEADFFDVINSVAHFNVVTDEGEEEVGYFPDFLCIVKQTEDRE